MGACPCSPIMPVGKTKRLQSFVDCILISGTSSAHKPPGRFLQPWTSMSNHFLIPAIPEQGDNEILKLLWRQSILWQQQLPQQSPRNNRQPLAHPGLSKPLTGRAELTHVDYGDPLALSPTQKDLSPQRSQLGYTDPKGSQEITVRKNREPYS